MSRPRRVICALGMAWALLAGCETLVLRSGDTQDAAGGVFMLTELAGGRQVFYGSVEVTSRTLEKALRRMGLSVSVEQQGEVVFLRGETRGGKKFALVLTKAPDSQKPDAGTYTHVAIEWEHRGDNEQGLRLFAELVLANAAGQAGAKK